MGNVKEKVLTGKKRILIIAAAALLLIIAVYFNYRLNSEDITQSTENAGGILFESSSAQQVNAVEDSSIYAGTDYFESFRNNRENVRSKELEYLSSIINDSRTDPETLKDAQEQKIEIVNNMEKEFTVESMLIAKGFKDAAVTLHQGSVNVIVDSEPLTAEQAAQILDIVLRETDVLAENVKVSAKG